MRGFVEVALPGPSYVPPLRRGVDVFGMRDHAFGMRRWAAFRRYLSIFVPFEACLSCRTHDACFGVLRVVPGGE